MRGLLTVLGAILLGLLITLAIRPLMGPLAPPPPAPDIKLSLPPTVPPSPAPGVPSPAPAVTPRPPAPPARTPTPRAARPAPRGTPARPAPAVSPAATPRGPVLYIVQVAVLSTRESAERLAGRLRAADFDPYLVRVEQGFAVRLGAFRERPRALRVARLAAGRGFSTIIVVQR